MDTSSRSIIATTVNFDQPFDVCRQLFYHYSRLVKLKAADLPLQLGFMDMGSSATTHQPTSQTKTHRPAVAPDYATDLPPQTQQGSHRPPSTDRPMPSDTADSGSPTLHRSRRDSISSLSSEAYSDTSDRPP